MNDGPPTTAAAIACSSRPTPALGSTTPNWIAFKSDARPVIAPMPTKIKNTTRRGRIPDSRAASASDPTA